MKISLGKLIANYYDKLNYLGTSYNKNHKQFIRVGNEEFAKTLVMHYDNLKLIRTTCEYAPELHKYFITLV